MNVCDQHDRAGKPWRARVSAVALAALLLPVPTFPQSPEPLEFVQAIPLPDVRGRIDHVDIDLDGARLFVAALGGALKIDGCIRRG